MYSAIAMAKPVLNDIIDKKIEDYIIKETIRFNLQLLSQQSKKICGMLH